MNSLLKTLDSIADKTLQTLFRKDSQELENFISAREIRELCIYCLIFGTVGASLTILGAWIFIQVFI